METLVKQKRTIKFGGLGNNAYFCKQNKTWRIIMKNNQNTVINEIRQIAVNSMPDGSKVLLYGSRARGDSHDDSDWDILLLVNKPTIEQEDYKTMVYPITSYGWDINEMIIPIIKTKKEWEEDPYTIFHKNVEQDAITIL